MGPLSKVMSMIPGIGSNLIPKGQEQEGVKRIKRFLTIMDSMTDLEMDCVENMSDSRIFRVARGSGNQIWEVKMLLEQHKQFSKMVSKMGKMGFAKKGGDIQQQMMRNPNQMMQKMQKMIDPKMLKQMGGPQNMMNLMKEIGKMENMPDMQEMMRQFGGGK